MRFHDVCLPTRLSFGATGGPERKTEVVTLASGYEERQSSQRHSRRRYDLGSAVAGVDDLAEIVAFFEARQGSLNGFRWQDPLDNKSCKPSRKPTNTDQLLGVGDGNRDTFQLVKRYWDVVGEYIRPIHCPIQNTIEISVGGIAQTLGQHFDLGLSGTIVFDQPPVEGVDVRVGFYFDVPVRFDCDRLDISLTHLDAGVAPNIPIVEVRL